MIIILSSVIGVFAVLGGCYLILDAIKNRERVFVLDRGDNYVDV